MKQKALAIILALCMVIAMFPATVFAAPAERTARIEARPQLTDEMQALPELPAETDGGKYKITATVVKGKSHGEVSLSATSGDTLDVIHLVANPDDGYLAQIGGSYEYLDYPMDMGYRGLDTYYIQMPDGNVNLEISFIAAEGSNHKITGSVNDSSWGSMSISRTSAKPNESVFIEATPASGYKLEALYATDGSGNDVLGGYMGNENGVEIFEILMPDDELIVYAEFTKIVAHTITWAVTPYRAGYIDVSKETAFPGETVTVQFHANPGFYLMTRMTNAGSWEHLGNEKYTFVMPDYDVEVSGEYRYFIHDCSVVVDTGIGGTASLDRRSGKPYEVVTLTCVPEEGYRVAQITGVEGITDLGNNVYSFEMPGGVDVEVHVLFLRNENPFVDVNETHFFYDPVLWAVENGITNGIDATHFGPFQTSNRAAVVTMLWRWAGSPEPATTENPFEDVPADSWYTKPVLWAVENGITTGISSTQFGPNSICNRAQVVTFLYRYLKASAPEGAENPFVDVEADSWYEAPVLWALANGITTGADATHFNPNGECLRAQFVTFLYRASLLPTAYDLHWVINGFQDTPSDYGTVELSHERAMAGETITATVIPAEGYQIDWVKCENGSEITQVSDTEYTFVMPEGEEVFHVNFVEIPEPEPTDPEPTDPEEPEPTDPEEPTEPVKTYTLDVHTNVNAEITYVDGKTSAAPGESIFFYVKPDPGYTLSGISIFDPYGEIDLSKIKLYAHEDDLYEFVMIDHDIILNFNFA